MWIYTSLKLPRLVANYRVVLSLLLLLFNYSVAGQLQAKEKKDEHIPEKTIQILPIVNGSITEVRHSWMAGLIVKYPKEEIPRSERLFCGGTLIRENWILTAAHCVVSSQPDDIQVFLGSNDLEDLEAEVVDVEEIVVHPFYPDSLSGNDIALLRLRSAVNRAPISLYEETRDSILSTLSATVYGWGNTMEKLDESCELEFEDADINESDYTCYVKTLGLGNERQRVLLEAQEAIITDAECEQIHLEFHENPVFDIPPLGDSSNASQNLCTYDPVESGDPCIGDSGGPLIVNVDGVNRQVGITSRGSSTKCIEPNALNIYTKVAFYLDFIDEVIGRDSTLGFDNYCPAQATIEASYQEMDNNTVLVTLSWSEIQGASTYIVRYIDQSTPDILGKVEFEARITNASARLPAGFDFLVSIQARGPNCDGLASKLLSVKG